MKRTILFLSILGQQAHAQLVHFADTTNKWHVADTYPHGSVQDPGFTETATTTYYHVGDTLIGPDTWSPMMAWPFAGAGGVPSFAGCAREADDLVLFLDAAEALDTLYDFSLQPGDSFYYPEPIGAFLYVAQVNNTMIADVQHRVIDFEPFLGDIPAMLNERWIEGIGSIHGPLFPRYPRSFSTEVPGDSLMLTCYERSDTLVWNHPGYAECVVNIMLGTAEPDPPPSALVAWPNPGADHIWFTGPPSIGSARIMDARGALILRSTSVDPLAGIDVAKLSPGPYLILLQPVSGRSVHMVWVKEE